MKSRTLTCITAITLFGALAIQVRLRLAAQEQGKEHTRYKLIDLGTFGGPTSYFSNSGFGNQVLNNAAVVAGSADTSAPDPFAPNCFNPDCFLTHAFRWHDGVLTDLGALPGANSSAAGAINARGWIVGISENGVIDPLTGFPESQAVLWKDLQITNLGTLGGNESVAVYVNNGGQVVGFATNATPDPFSLFGLGTQIRTFLWEKGIIRDLGTLGGPDAVPASGCGNQRNGLVAGASYTNSKPNPTTGIPTVDPFRWENDTMLDLGTLGGTFGAAQCVNSQGQVIGVSNLAGDLITHPFLWDHGTLTDLGTLVGDNGTVNWLNDAGEVVGKADLPGSKTHDAFLWKDGVMTDLGTQDGDPCSNALAINSSGQIVGGSSDCFTFIHAFLWENGGPMTDLNALIPPNSALQLILASNINDRGEIVGLGLPRAVPPGTNPDFGGHVFLLIPCGNDKEGCEGNGEGAIATTQSTPTPATQRPATATPGNPALSDRPSGILDRLRSRRFPGHRSLGPTTGRAN